MVYLEFEFRPSTQEEILIFSEEYSNTYRLNPEVKFITAVLQDENYAVFAIKENDNNFGSEIRVLFFLILEHSLKLEYTIYKVKFRVLNKFTKKGILCKI